MEPITTFITTLGFPIAAAAGVAFFFYKFLIRVMDENKAREAEYKAREDKFQELLVAYGEKMAEISHNLLEIRNDICDLKAAEEKKPEA